VIDWFLSGATHCPIFNCCFCSSHRTCRCCTCLLLVWVFNNYELVLKS